MSERDSGHRIPMADVSLREQLSADLELHSRALFALTMRAMDGVPSQLSPSALRALLALDHRGACKLSDLAEELHLSQPAVSRLVDRLVDNGLVTRRVSPDSRREVRLSASARGVRTARSVLQRRHRAIQQVLAAMRPEDVAHLAKGLAAFAAAAQEP